MKRIIPVLLSASLIFLSCSLSANDLETYQKDTDAVWRAGSGAQDGAFTSIATSMMGWGIGLAVGIGILASVLHQSTASTAHSTCH